MGDCYIHVARHLVSAFNLLYLTDGRSLFTTALGLAFLSIIHKKKILWKIWRVLTKLYAY